MGISVCACMHVWCTYCMYSRSIGIECKQAYSSVFCVNSMYVGICVHSLYMLLYMLSYIHFYIYSVGTF